MARKLGTRHSVTVALVVFLAVLGTAPGGTADAGPKASDAAIESEFVPGELLVGFRPGGGVEAARQGMGAAELATFAEIGVRHWRLPEGLTVADAIRILSRNPNVRYAEPNYIYHADVLPNDARRNELYGMHNLGQTGGTADADIDALEAWQEQTGSANVVVGDIDTGVDYNHVDLAANI